MKDKVCEVCGKHFVPVNYWQKYCSKSCKQAAWAMRKYKSGGEIKKEKD